MKTQSERVISKLKNDGYITRNECLKNFISRLSAIIQDLELEGWVFKTERVKGDYKYTVVTSPLKEIVYKLPDGREIKQYARK